MGDIKGWFTMNGMHIPIMEGQSKAEAATRYINSKHGKTVAELTSKGKSTLKTYEGKMVQEGSKRYFQNEDGSKIEYLKPKDYDKMCEDFNNNLTDEERNRVLDYVDMPSYGASSELNRQPSKEDAGDGMKYAYNKNPDNLMTRYERDKKTGRSSEQIEGMKKDPKYIEHNEELRDLRVKQTAEYEALRKKIPDGAEYYASKEYKAIEKQSEKINALAQSYGLPTNRSEYGYQANIDYFKLKDTYYSENDLEYVSTYQYLQKVRQGKTANQAADTIRRGKTAIRDQNEMDKIFNEKGIVLDKDIIVYRRAHEDESTIRNGYTKLGYTSTTAKSTLQRRMPSGAPFGETELEIIIPKGTRVLPLKGVIQNRYNKIKNKNIDDIKNEKWLSNQAEILLPRETKFTYVSSSQGEYINYNKGFRYKYTVVADTSASKNFKYKSKKLVDGVWEYEY